MSERTAIRPVVEPGEYPCVWLLPDPAAGGTVRVHGFVTLEGSRPAQGLAWGPEVPWHGEEFPQRATYPSIRCELSTGQVATLIDATVSTWFPQRARITAAVALVGMSFPLDDVAEVSSAEVQITGLDAVAGTAPLDRKIFFPTQPGARSTFEAGASPNARIEWEDATTSIVFDYASSSAPADVFGIDHRFSPLLMIDLDVAVPVVDFCGRWIDPVRWLIALATRSRQYVALLTVIGETEAHEEGRWSLYATGITQEPYNSNEETVRDARSALALGPDGDSLLSLVNRWVDLTEDLHPVIHTFGRQTVAIGRAAPSSAFQTLIQTIEGTYRTENAAIADAARKRHAEKRDEVVQMLKDAGATAKQRKFARSAIGSYPAGSLNDALLWADEALSGALAAAIEPLALVQAQIESGDTWADGVRKTRNDLAHGNKAFDSRELDEVVTVLRRFCTALTLRLLESSDAAQARATRRIE